MPDQPHLDTAPAPDIIDPTVPAETPPDSIPDEAPVRQPAEIEPLSPDTDQPGIGPDEVAIPE